MTINRLFKESPEYQLAPDTSNEFLKSEHTRKQLDAKMTFILDTTLKTQTKRKISGDAGELERLLTVLYHEMAVNSRRPSTRLPDD